MRLEMNRIFDSLSTIGHRPLILGNKIHLLPFGGRVLGLYPRDGLNTLWTNPELEAPESAAALLRNPKWTNLGGDRTWLSPEVDLFIADPADPINTYKVPEAFDPGNYQVVAATDRSASLETAITVKFFRSKCTAALRLQKRVDVLDAPDFRLPAGIDAAGYKLECRLSAAVLPKMIRPAMWHLLQVPGPGKIIVPVKRAIEPTAFFGKQRFQWENGCITAVIPATEWGYKFGIKADDCRGLMLYLNLTAATPFLVLRRFEVGNQDDYFDAPLSAMEKRGFAQAFYLEDGFGEMEYHSPALIPDLRNEIVDRSIVWAFAGPAAKLMEIAENIIAEK